MWLLAACFINAFASKTPSIIQQALEKLQCVATQLTDTRDTGKEIREYPDAEEVKDGEIVRWVGGGCKSARKTTVHCFYLVVSPPCPNWQKDLAHFTVSPAEAERCTSHA